MSRKRQDADRNLPVPIRKPGRNLVPVKGLSPVSGEFQSDAVEIEHRAPPRIARLTLYGVSALILSAIAWASLSYVDEIVVAQGRLVTTQPTIVVQPFETSIVRSIDVSAGDVVRMGQTLATLDATFSQSNVNQQRARHAALDAQVKRIEAELAGDDYSLLAGDTAEEAIQVQLFGQRRAFYVAQMQNFDQQVSAQMALLAGNRDQEAVLRARRENLSRIEGAREKLYENQAGSLLNLLDSREARLEIDSSLAQTSGNAAVALHTLAKLRADRQAFIEDFRRATLEQLVGLRSERDTVGEELTKMELRRTMVALTAPADAVVLDLAQRSVGSVVREAEPIVTLVPLNVPLEAEVSVNSRDIGRVSVEEPARIKFDAFPFQKYGTATGSVRTISRDAFLPDGEGAEAGTQPYFKARVRLEDTRLRLPDKIVQLLPGMTVAAEIKVGRRTVISYFLYPLIRGLDESIREP